MSEAREPEPEVAIGQAWTDPLGNTCEVLSGWNERWECWFGNRRRMVTTEELQGWHCTYDQKRDGPEESFNPPGLKFPEGVDPEDPFEDVYDERPQEASTFKIGQLYEKVPSRDVFCAICGGTEFNVSRGQYFTGIRCVTCRWERCIHDG